ncbi:MAG TPA: TetR family transcriptional regulator [Segetibacter sp.]|jgi:AcrR family transcriptional regulator
MALNDKGIHIINTAERLFSSNGYDGTSVRDIADEAGVNIAMISYYFGSKEKLMEALFEQKTVNIKFKIERLLQDEELNPLQKIESLITDYVNTIMEKQQFFRIMICEQVINKNPVIVNMIKELKKRNANEISKLIADGQQKGDFRKNVDVVLLMNTLTGSVTQTILSIDYYREYNNLESISKDQFLEELKVKLIDHIQILFKALLSHEV